MEIARENVLLIFRVRNDEDRCAFACVSEPGALRENDDEENESLSFHSLSCRYFDVIEFFS